MTDTESAPIKLKTPEEWEQICHLVVREPSGWRHPEKKWSEPISREEFEERAKKSMSVQLHSPSNYRKPAFPIIHSVSSTVGETSTHELLVKTDDVQIRHFETGATRNPSTHKINPAKAMSSLVMERYCRYMASRRVQPGGEIRSDDNWKKGIDLDSYMESGQRHNLHWLEIHDGFECTDEDSGEKVDLETACCALLFNVSGYLHEILKAKSVPLNRQ
jgi:hypothetical protein